MDKFWELFQESVIVQAVVTLLLIATMCALAIRGQSVPDWLIGFTSLVLGFWFGTKSQAAIMKARRL
jgi:glycerol uptake facilitator-like aquaporin